MRTQLLGTVVLSSLVAAGATAAQSAPASEPKAAQTPAAVKAAADLKAKAALALKAREAALATAHCVFVMPMIPADPTLDAAIRKNPPADTTFTIKKVPPPPCIRK